MRSALLLFFFALAAHAAGPKGICHITHAGGKAFSGVLVGSRILLAGHSVQKRDPLTSITCEGFGALPLDGTSIEVFDDLQPQPPDLAAILLPKQYETPFFPTQFSGEDLRAVVHEAAQTQALFLFGFRGPKMIHGLLAPQYRSSGWAGLPRGLLVTVSLTGYSMPGDSGGAVAIRRGESWELVGIVRGNIDRVEYSTAFTRLDGACAAILGSAL